MKRKAWIIMAAIAVIASACQKQETELLRCNETEYAIRSFHVADSLSDRTASKSILDVSTEAIRNLCAFAFDTSTGEMLRYKRNVGNISAGAPVMAYVEGSSSFEWALPIGAEMDIYAVCNLGRLEAPENLSGFLDSPDLVCRINDVSDLNDPGIPMTAILKNVKEEDDGSPLILPVRRIVSKYSLKLSDMPAGYEVKGIRISNVSAETTLFAENEAADGSSTLITGDWATSEDIASLNSGGRVTFFMFENAQTTARGVTQSSGTYWHEVHEALGENAEYCTYLDIISEYKGNTRRDRLYLGGDCIKDFDVLRNTVRNITCPAACTVNPGSGQDAMEFIESLKIGPGQTAYIPFSYNLSLSGADPSEIAFTSDDGLTLGLPEFTDNGSRCGTGRIPVTCSSSAGIGDRYTIRMSAGEASAQTSAEVINCIISFSISAEAINLMAMSTKLKARALYADGTEITDPSQFTWRLSNDLAIIEDGILRRNGYTSGAVIVIAEYDGVLSNSLKINLNHTIKEIEFEPVPVNISAGKTSICSLYECTRNLMTGNVIRTRPTAVMTQVKAGDPSIASASISGNGIISVKGISDGQTDIMIAYNHGSYNYSYLDVPVIVGDYSYGLLMTPSSIELEKGRSVPMKVYFQTFCKGTLESSVDVTDKAEWSSGRTSIATVSGGLIKAVGYGTCMIAAVYNGYRASCKVTVPSPAEHELAVIPDKLSISVGSGYQLKAILYTIVDGTRVSSSDVTQTTYWFSFDPAIADISENGYVTGVGEGTVHLGAEYDNGRQYVIIEVTVSDDRKYTNELLLSRSSATMDIGTEVSLSATMMSYIDGVLSKTSDVTGDASWTSSDSSVAIVSGGTVKGVSAGSATITATYSGYSARCSIIVAPPATEYAYEITVNPSSMSVQAGSSGKFTATYMTYADGTLIESTDITSACTWSSSDPSVLTADKGTVNGIKEGSATVTASYKGISASAEVTVTAKPATYTTYDIVISPEEMVLEQGKTGKLSAYFRTFADGTLQSSTDVTESADWSSSKPGVAEIVKGSVTATAEGSATAYASYNGYQASAKVTVTAKPVTYTYDIIISPEEMVLEQGKTGKLSAYFRTFADGTLQSSTDVTESADWSSSKPGVTEIVKGSVTATAEGSATAYASYNGYQASAKVTVTAKPVTYTYDIIISPEEMVLEQGKTGKLSAYFRTFADGTLQSSTDVTESADWSSSKPGVAEIVKGGVTAIAEGAARAYASYDGYSASAEIQVLPAAAHLEYISVTPSFITGYNGDKAEVSVTAHYSDDSTDDISGRCTWASTAISIATYSSGTVSCNATGNAVITLSFEGKIADINVSVKTLGPESVFFDCSSISLMTGDTYQVSVEKVILNNGRIIYPSASELTWSSSHPSTAAVSGGMVTGMKAGSATITGTYTSNGISASGQISVTVADPVVEEPEVVSVSISGFSNVSLAGSVHISATATYSDGSIRDVTSSAAWYAKDGIFESSSGGVVIPLDSSSGKTGRVYCIYEGVRSDDHSITVVNDVRTISGWLETIGGISRFGMEVSLADGTSSRTGFDWEVTHDSNSAFIGRSGHATSNGQNYSKGSNFARIMMTSSSTYLFLKEGKISTGKAECSIEIYHADDNL